MFSIIDYHRPVRITISTVSTLSDIFHPAFQKNNDNIEIMVKAKYLKSQ